MGENLINIGVKVIRMCRNCKHIGYDSFGEVHICMHPKLDMYLILMDYPYEPEDCPIDDDSPEVFDRNHKLFKKLVEM